MIDNQHRNALGTDDLTRHVLSVLDYGLKLKERLATGEVLVLDTESARLKQMLWGDGAVRGHDDYKDNAPRPVPIEYQDFLGVRYALTCWLDEIFISDPQCAWQDEWTEKALEPELYGGGQERAWRFWRQAEKAEKRPGAEALEAFLWCIMLGFRGAPENLTPPRSPATFAEDVRRRTLAARQQTVPLPADKGLPTDVPALRGRDRFRTAGRLLVLAIAGVLFAAAVYFAKYFSYN